MTLNKKQETNYSSSSDSMCSDSESDTDELDKSIQHKEQDTNKKIVEMPNDTLDGNSNIETNFKKLKVSVLREMVYNKKLVDSKNKAKKLKKEQLINLLTA